MGASNVRLVIASGPVMRLDHTSQFSNARSRRVNLSGPAAPSHVHVIAGGAGRGTAVADPNEDEMPRPGAHGIFRSASRGLNEPEVCPSTVIILKCEKRHGRIGSELRKLQPPHDSPRSSFPRRGEGREVRLEPSDSSASRTTSGLSSTAHASRISNRCASVLPTSGRLGNARHAGFAEMPAPRSSDGFGFDPVARVWLACAALFGGTL